MLSRLLLYDTLVTFQSWSCSRPFPKGVTDLVIDCIDRLHQCSSAPQPGDVAGEEKKNMLNCFYELLGEI